MEKEKILKHLNNAFEVQVPDVWDNIQSKIHQVDKSKSIYPTRVIPLPQKRKTFRRFYAAAAICLIVVPALASIRDLYNKIFLSDQIDDTGLKTALSDGLGQTLDQTYYDKNHDITVHFESVLTDDKETKLLVTYQSKKTNLKNYYLDIFEGKTSINLDGYKKLKCVGWGSRHYDPQENKVSEALSFESIKPLAGKNVHLEIKNLTIYEKNKSQGMAALWPVSFTLDQSAVADRESIELNKTFNFENFAYTIKKAEFSPLETRVVVTGSDTKMFTDENGMKYKVISRLENKYLTARKFSKENGYTFDEKKSGILVRSAGEKGLPIFSKSEVKGGEDEYIMTFEPVKNSKDCVLEVGEDLKIPLYK